MPKLSLKNLRLGAFLLMDALVVGLHQPSPNGGDAVVIRVDAIGDFVLWLAAAKPLVESYRRKGKGVTLLANSLWADWASELGLFDEVIPVNRARFESDIRYRFSLARKLNARRFSEAVQPTYSRDLHGDALMRLSGAPERIGSVGDHSNAVPWHKRLGDRWYTRLLDADPGLVMELKRNAEFLQKLGVVEHAAAVPDLRGAISAVEPSLMADNLPNGPLYILFPGASWSGKQWPENSFIEVAERLYREMHWSGVVCGGPDDRELAERICRKADPPLLNWAGRTSLSQLAMIIARADLLVSNDTAAIHIGAALGVPSVCLLGGGHYGRFLPYQVEQRDARPLPRAAVHPMPCFSCNWQCIYDVPPGAPVPCVRDISVDDVWATIRDLLETRQ